MSVTFNGSSYLELTGDYVGASINEALFIWMRPRGASLTGNTAPMSIGVDGAGGELSIITIGGTAIRAQSRNGSVSAFAEQAQTLSDTWFPVLVRFNSQTSRDVRIASVGPASDTTDNRMLDAGAPNRLRIGVRGYELNLYFVGDLAEPAAWSGTLPDATDWTNLVAGALPETIKPASLTFHRTLLSHTDLVTGGAGPTPTAVGTLSTGATHPITRSASGFLQGATLARTIAAGTLQAVASAFVGGALLRPTLAGGSIGPAPGVITSQPLLTNNGTLLASVALDYVDVYLEASGVFVGRFTGLSTNGLGEFTVTSALLTPGTAYKLDWRVTGGQRRMPTATAA